MSTAAITIKIQSELKKQAQIVAREHGVSLTELIKKYLHSLVKTKTHYQEKPLELTDWAKKELKEVRKDKKAGKVSPSFYNVEDAISWLNDSEAKYENGDKIRK